MHARVALVRTMVTAPFWVLTMLLITAATCGAGNVEDLPSVQSVQTDTLGAGDEIEVIVFGEPELSGKQKIRPGGTIRLPLVGSVQAAGLNPDELAVRISTAYNERYLKNAEVTVNVITSTSNNVYVFGSVAKPGSYPVSGKMTLINALALAGGTTKMADEGRVQITRTVGTKQTFVVVNASDVRRGSADDVELIPGDVVFVPESPL